jgi:hypothetical protein
MPAFRLPAAEAAQSWRPASGDLEANDAPEQMQGSKSKTETPETHGEGVKRLVNAWNA